MKITVFSDSHGAVEVMLLAAARSRPNMFIHLGDNIRDTQALKKKFPRKAVKAVKGNCDLAPGVQDTEVVMLDGVKALVTHGHRYMVKSDLSRLAGAAVKSGASLALYGHTHIAHFEVINGVLLLNPGAIGDWENPSYAEIVTNGDSFEFEIKYFKEK